MSTKQNLKTLAALAALDFAVGGRPASAQDRSPDARTPFVQASHRDPSPANDNAANDNGVKITGKSPDRRNGAMTATRVIAIVDRFALGLMYAMVIGGLPLVAASLLVRSI